MKINNNYVESIYGQSTFPIPAMIRLDGDELKQLGKALDVSFAGQQLLLESAVSRFIQAAPFVHTLPQKKDVARFANGVSNSARHLAELLTYPADDHSVQFHVVHLISSCFSAPEEGLTIRVVLEYLDSIASISSSMAHEFKSEPVRSRRPTDYVFRAYLQQLSKAARLAKAKVRLPSNKDRDIGRSTPFLAFLRNALAIAVTKGLVAIAGLPLSPDERNTAETSLRGYLEYTDRRIIDGLRPLRSKKDA